MNAWPDFHAALQIGSSTAPFSTIDFAGALNLAADKSLEATTTSSIVLSAVASDIAVSGGGSVTLTTGRNLVLNPGSSITDCQWRCDVDGHGVEYDDAAQLDRHTFEWDHEFASDDYEMAAARFPGGNWQ